ncbi:MAG TPA: N-acetylmuramoyl-L-alanine amidase [Candidatus Binataceae bacterium]|nr:N-acetylmuramoyl-L-alanine amidase [Candidatus Binataceae bacterium]
MISGARLITRGPATELRFKLQGDPGWRLSRHGTELWIDLEATRSVILPRPLIGQETAPIKTVRVIDAGGGQVRVVIEVSEKSDYAVATIPGSLIIRIAAAGTAPDLAAPIPVRFVPPSASRGSGVHPVPLRRKSPWPGFAGTPPDSGETAVGPARQAQVVIDAGHGGYDPGTRSASNVLEKDCALQIALRLADDLRARGVGVSLTRDGDYFVSLADRTRLANRAGADLFVSIHLNWSPNSATNGIEVYYLNNTTDRATIRLARMENLSGASDSMAGKSDLNYILSDLRQNDKAAASATLAEMIDTQSATNLRDEFGAAVHVLGAKRGPFYVLVGADMPAVLIECGFLSNPAEAERLATPQYQAQMAQAIAGAVVRYLNQEAAQGTL